MARGTIRVYLGAAPGVGTTYSMLAEGRRRADRGAEVVVGAVDTHGRDRTAALLEGFAVVALVDGAPDIDEVLARRPRVVLVDDLAGRGARTGEQGARWRDVERLAAEGIDVVSTLWIGHVESQRDIVERITGREVTVGVPDAFLATVDQVELVDMTPEALRRRLAHGSLYGPDEIDGAVLDLYRPGTLTALRQLALLWVAARIDEPLLDYLDAHGITERWETRERVVVAITGAPGNDAAIRRAARLARRNNGELLGLHVTGRDGVAETSDGRLAGQRDLLVRLGGHYHEVVGDDVARALVMFTRAERATQLVIGASRRSRWATLRHGSVVNTITRELRDTDLHIIAAPTDGEVGELPRPASSPAARRRALLAWLVAAVGLPVVVVAGLGVEEHTRTGPLFALLATVAVVAALGGVAAGVVSAVAASLLANWFFTPPRHTLRVTQGEDVVTFVVFVGAAVAIAALVGALGRRTDETARARAEAEALARSTGTLIGARDPLPGLLRQMRSTFGLDAVAVFRKVDDSWHLDARAGATPVGSPDEGEAIELADGSQLVLVGKSLGVEDRRLLRALADQLGTALAARGLHARAAEAGALAEATNLRTAMLQSVSHDLRTPLASIKTSVTSLLHGDVAFTDDERRDLLETVDEETDRLDHVVGNLLDMSRLQADALTPTDEIVDLEDAVGAALAAIAAPVAAVAVRLPGDLPAVRADPVLLERVLSNVIANALAWAPAGIAVRVDARTSPERVILRIADAGPGIAPARRTEVFTPFLRLGDRSGQAGVGLGLAVAQGFTQAMGGDLELDDTPGGGLTVFVSLPRAGDAPERP